MQCYRRWTFSHRAKTLMFCLAYTSIIFNQVYSFIGTSLQFILLNNAQIWSNKLSVRLGSFVWQVSLQLWLQALRQPLTLACLKLHFQTIHKLNILKFSNFLPKHCLKLTAKCYKLSSSLNMRAPRQKLGWLTDHDDPYKSSCCIRW